VGCAALLNRKKKIKDYAYWYEFDEKLIDQTNTGRLQLACADV